MKTASLELSPQQFKVVELIALGLAQKEVANALHISVNTVDVTVKNAKAKLNIQKAAELSVWYFVKRYGITLNLNDEVRRVVSLSFLTLILWVSFAGFSPERATRSTRSGRRFDSEYNLTTL